MKKVTLVLLFAVLAMSVAMAQNAIPKSDVLGAHNNGGRGCAGCHAPHSGGRGNGGDLVAGSGVSSTGGAEGDWHLWGQDVSLITQETLTFGGGFAQYEGVKYTVNFGGAQQWTIGSGPLISGIAICLSCHDGNVSKGAMMMNQSYEGNNGLLPNGNGQGTTANALYGTTPIPTLLGADGGPTLGDYLNDHPVGNLANFNALNYPQSLQAYGLTFSNVNGTVTYTATGQYAQFIQNYGDPAIQAMVVDATNTTPYVVCTTCHNQHQMNIYLSSAASPIAGNKAGTYTSYFFVNAPYNPGSAWTPSKAPSTTQFCRQCHFGEANEAFGLNTVTTAF